MPDPFLRDEFPILRNRIYLNSCSLGALSNRSESYLRSFVEQWHGLGASAWYAEWLTRIEELRSRVAAAQGARAEQVALVPTTSMALASVAESVSTRDRNRVVCTELDFPTLVYQWRVRPEIELVVLRSPDGIGVYPEQFEEAIDERTLFLATSHVFFTTGFVQDLATLSRIARNAGASTLIDGYQGAGQLPLDLPRTGVDFYSWGPLKWLCGGPGLAYLYVRRPGDESLRPRLTSWFAQKRPFDFDVEAFDLRDDARRFELGTPSVATVHTALGGQELVDEVGMEAVWARNRELTELLIESALSVGLGLRVSDDLDRRSAIVMVRDDDASGTVRRLAAEGVVVDHRPGHVRVSPHFYNTEAEVERCVELLAAAGR